ncbi:MAG TPA: cupin domain-containing protein [Nitrospinota bacterium]|jgi:quercetin dioxygenase-like cupin family protein|nr:cupin domain-containing protein [Nitrospinota bacterium]
METNGKVIANVSTVAPLDMGGKKVGGVLLEGQVDLWVLLTGERLQMVELHIGKGYFHPLHSHPEHESIGYVISGKLEMRIGEEEHTLGPGDAWHHGVGVAHWTRGLEDTRAVEIHGPPRPEYS